jgi:hypothetical protein
LAPLSHLKKKQKATCYLEQKMCFVDVNLHLELTMVAQKMVDIGNDIEESSKEDNHDNWNNEHNTNI